MSPKKTLVCAGFICLAAAPLASFAQDDEEVLEFEEAEVFFELNNTDGDLGIHALIDGGPWKLLEIHDVDDRKMLQVNVRGRMRRQGLTEIFFESAEPTFDELPPAEFFERFPPGTYVVSGVTLDGEKLENEVEISHTMPAPPVPTVNGEPLDTDCEDDEFTEVSSPVVIAWKPVKKTHSELGDPQNSGRIKIINYEVVVEAELEPRPGRPDGEEFVSVFSVILPPGVTTMTIPDEFLAQAEEFKYEVLAREESWNQTAIESCFVLEE